MWHRVLSKMLSLIKIGRFLDIGCGSRGEIVCIGKISERKGNILNAFVRDAISLS